MTRAERRRARIRRRRQRLAGIASLLTAMLVAGVVAWAYWTTAGTGVASATTAVLAAPAAVTAEASGSTVTVSWTGSAAPGGGAVDGYFVERLVGSTATPACGSSSASPVPATPTGCDDPSVADGTYTYRVTAVWRSWTAVSAQSASVLVDATPPTVPAPTLSAAVTYSSDPVFVDGETVSLHDLATDAGSGVGEVGYYFCAAAASPCTSAEGSTLIGRSTGAPDHPVSWDTSAVADGAYRVIAVASDGSANEATSPGLLVSVDRTAPTASAPTVDGKS